MILAGRTALQNGTKRIRPDYHRPALVELNYTGLHGPVRLEPEEPGSGIARPGSVSGSDIAKVNRRLQTPA